MKKLMLAIMIPSLLFALACNNSTDSKTTKDSVSIDVNTGTTVDDTSSYERMPNKVSDSVQ